MSKDHLANPMTGFSLSASYAEFKQKAHLVPVVPTRDPSGRVMWLCRDNPAQPDSFGALRQFVFHCQRYLQSVTGEKMDDVACKQWVDQSVSYFLDPAHTPIDGLYYAIGPVNHVLILYRDDCAALDMVTRDTMLGAVWCLERDAPSA
jgi:hypothetical protein